jgi:chromosome segregation ATPase
MIPTASQPTSYSYTLPILAGAGLSAATLAATDLSGLTQRATAALGLAGLVGGSIVGGIIFAVTKYDQVKLARQKLYEDANKDSLSKQIEDMTAQAKVANDASLVNQERMRESLHQLRNDAQRAAVENHELRADLATLRTQFMAVSKQLHETDLLLHTARAEMHDASLELKHTADALATSERDRRSLREQIAALRSGQHAQDTRLDLLEHASEEEDVPFAEGSPDPPSKSEKAVS